MRVSHKFWINRNRSRNSSKKLLIGPSFKWIHGGVLCAKEMSKSRFAKVHRRSKVGWKIRESSSAMSARSRLLHLLSATMSITLRGRHNFRKMFLDTVVFRVNAREATTGWSPRALERGHRTVPTGGSTEHHVHGKEGRIVVARWWRRQCPPEMKWNLPAVNLLSFHGAPPRFPVRFVRASLANEWEWIGYEA